MSEDLVLVEPSDALRPARAASTARLVLPQLIVDAGPVAVARFLEFFAARIANRRTRAAYGRAVGQFLAWCEARGLALAAVSPLHVAAYIRTHPGSAPTVKQHLAAIRMLGDWLVVSQVLPVNPAAAVRGPPHVVTTGATPVLSPAEARRLFEAIDTGTLAGLRDRALVSVSMLYSVARVSAVIGMRRQDYFRQERQGWLRLHEKGGQRHDVPAHHRAAEALDDYLVRAGLDEAPAALFQSVDPAGRRLTGRALSRRLVLAMIKRRAAAAGLPPSTCCHILTAGAPLGLGLGTPDILTKMSIRRLEIDKGSRRRLYYPDYMVVIAGLSVVVVEAKKRLFADLSTAVMEVEGRCRPNEIGVFCRSPRSNSPVGWRPPARAPLLGRGPARRRSRPGGRPALEALPADPVDFFETASSKPMTASLFTGST